MAITGNNDDLYKASINMNVGSYDKAVGSVQGEVVKDSDSWASSDDKTKKNFWGQTKVTDAGSRNSGNYGTDTVQGASGAYVLKGKAGITPQFYTAFSDAFDVYKGVIKKDLADLETNPNIHQAFSGTEIEKAVKKLIEAVEAEAHDYLYKLEVAEKTVINSVQNAFKKQQQNMSNSMNADTAKLSDGNAKQEDMDRFAERDVAWGGTPDGSGTSGGNAGARTNPSVVRNLTY